MDTRDQTLTKLTRLHDKSHPTHHRPASLRWNYSRTAVSIMKLVMEEGWWWRWRQIPSLEPRTDSRSDLPREIRAWRQLRIVKRDESFSLIFFSPNTNIWSWSWGRWSVRGPTMQGARVDRVWAPWHGFFFQYFSYFLKICSVEFQVIPRMFVSAHK